MARSHSPATVSTGIAARTWRISISILIVAAASVVLGGCSTAASPAVTDRPEPVPSVPASTNPATPTPSASASRSPHVTAMPSAPASDVTLHLVAEDVRWDVTALNAPAAMTFKVELDNRDGPPEFHNFVIADGPAVGDRIYTSPKRQGPIIETYEIPGLPAGTYTFVCTLHPDVMRGALTVG